MEREQRAALLPMAGLPGSARLFSACWGKRKTEGGTTTSRERVMRGSDPFALRWLEAQAHRRAWVSLGWVRRYC
jgi:hypothetical protein